jgi:glycosyltransferase involved in cell wall biosynthesis
MTTSPSLPPTDRASVTVVVPTCGRTVFLEDALRSVLAQTHPVQQILLVDDGCPEPQRQEAQRLAGISERIELHCLPAHRGASAARNAGLELASGDFILFLDDDDLLHPRMLETSLAAFAGDPALDVVTCLYEMFFTPAGGDGAVLAAPLFNWRLLDQHPLRLVDRCNFVPGQLLAERPFSAFLRHLIPVNSCLVKRRAIGSVRFPEDLVQGEDTYFWLSLARHGCRFKLRDETHVYIRRHPLNLTRSRARYYDEIRPLYRRLLSERMVTEREDRFLVHLKLAYFEWHHGERPWLSHLLQVCAEPDLLLREVVKFGDTTLCARRNLLRYYFLD